MNIITRALGMIGFEKRAVDPSWGGAALLRTTPTGAAESLSSVYACVSAISETIASLPLILYRRTADDGRERAKEHSLFRVLHDQANDIQTALEFREQMQAAMLLRGNAYAEIIRDYAGQVTALIPLNSVNVLLLDNGRLSYEVSNNKGQMRRLLQEEVFHLRHRSDNGILGVAPITASRQTVELALAERDHGTTTFTNGTKLSGMLKFPQKLKADQRTALSNSWNTQYSGGANAGKTAILEEGVEYQAISMSMADAEWVEARKFSVEEVARLFRCPPTIIGDMSKANYSNSVELSRQFVTLTLRRHIVCWEQAISRSLLTEAGRQVYFAEHSVEGLLRGDSTNRAEFYKSGIEAGWLDVEEVRKLENLPKRQHATSNEATQTGAAKAETGSDQMPGAHPVAKVASVAAAAKVGS